VSTGATDHDWIVETHALKKSYAHGHVQALDGIDLQVARGEFVAITGPSGCGKSTLLAMLAALEEPDSGTIRVDGWDASHRHRVNQYRRNVVGLVFQLHNLLPHLTAQQNVEVVMLGTHRSRAVQRAAARQLLEEVRLGDKLDRKPPEMSGGERQRVAIARALANNPSVLLADEPTGSLDPDSVELVLELFSRLREDHGLTVVMVTHDRDVASTADRIVHMSSGGRLVDPQPTGSTDSTR